MIDINELKSKFSSIHEVQILNYKAGDNFVYYKITISFIDSSQLLINEFASLKERKYSFHWQNNENELIIRWDNAPHHKNISTFPHHKHSNGEISPSNDISLEDVLSYIDTTIS